MIPVKVKLVNGTVTLSEDVINVGVNCLSCNTSAIVPIHPSEFQATNGEYIITKVKICDCGDTVVRLGLFIKNMATKSDEFEFYKWFFEFTNGFRRCVLEDMYLDQMGEPLPVGVYTKK